MEWLRFAWAHLAKLWKACPPLSLSTPVSRRALVSNSGTARPFEMGRVFGTLKVGPACTLDQTQRRSAGRAVTRIRQMLHPRCSGFRLVAGLQEIFQRFSQMLGDLKSTSRPRIFDGLQVDHAR